MILGGGDATVGKQPSTFWGYFKTGLQNAVGVLRRATQGLSYEEFLKMLQETNKHRVEQYYVVHIVHSCQQSTTSPLLPKIQAQQYCWQLGAVWEQNIPGCLVLGTILFHCRLFKSSKFSTMWTVVKINAA